MTDFPRMTTGPIRELTPAQRRVVDGIGRGLSYKEIAAEMRISEHTVKGHVRALANKFDDPKELPPRSRILMWAKSEEWASKRR